MKATESLIAEVESGSHPFLYTEENFPMRNLGWLATVKRRPTTSETLLTTHGCKPFTIRSLYTIFAQRSDSVMRSSFYG